MYDGAVEEATSAAAVQDEQTLTNR